MAARCVVQVGQGKSVIRLVNPTNKRIHLPRRYVLANVIDINTDHINKLDEHSVHTIQASTVKPTRDNLQFDLSQSDLIKSNTLHHFFPIRNMFLLPI